MHVLRFQKSPRRRPNDGHSAVLDGGDGVCPGMEVLQERQREDALLCPRSRVQRVCMMFNSAIHFLVLFQFELPICALPYNGDAVCSLCSSLPLSVIPSFVFLPVHKHKSASKRLQSRNSPGLFRAIFPQFPLQLFLCDFEIKVRDGSFPH